MNPSKTDSREPSRCPHSHRSSGKRQTNCTWEHRGTLPRFPQIFETIPKFHRIFSWPVSSNKTIEPFLRSGLPSTTVRYYFHSSPESVIPRLREIAEYLFRPGSLRT